MSETLAKLVISILLVVPSLYIVLFGGYDEAAKAFAYTTIGMVGYYWLFRDHSRRYR